jgi:hypothetical protein
VSKRWVRLLSADAATVDYVFTIHRAPGDPSPTLTRFATLVCVKQNGLWKVGALRFGATDAQASGGH